MLAFSILIAGSFTLGGLMATLVDPAALMALRFAIAGVLIGCVIGFGPGFRRAYLRAPWRFLLLGALMAVYFVTMFEGLKTATPVSTAAVFTLTPVMSACVGWLLLRQVTTGRMALALAIGAVGAIWVIFRADLAALLAFDLGRGEAIYFVGCIGHAAVPALVRRLNRGEPPLVSTFGTLMGGFVVLAIYAAPELAATDWAGLPGIVWMALAYLSVVASGITFFLLQFASLRLPGAKVMAYTYLTPVWVTLLEGVIGHGWPAPLVLVGMGLVVVSILLLLKA